MFKKNSEMFNYLNSPVHELFPDPGRRDLNKKQR